jgi:hypothetical protein
MRAPAIEVVAELSRVLDAVCAQLMEAGGLAVRSAQALEQPHFLVVERAEQVGGTALRLSTGGSRTFGFLAACLQRDVRRRRRTVVFHQRPAGPARAEAAVASAQPAVVMNSSVGLGFGNAPALGLASVNSGLNALPWLSSPW